MWVESLEVYCLIITCVSRYPTGEGGGGEGGIIIK